MEEMVEYSLTPIQIQDNPNAKPLRANSGQIKLDHIHFRYPGQKNPVFRDLSLEIFSGEKVALVGHSGSGKSTLVKLIQRFYEIQSGQITIDQQDITQVTQKSLRESISLVPQDPILFHRSLSDNISYAVSGNNKEAIIEASKKAYAHEFIKALPEGYKTLVGERGIKLSGGERQRVAIARAFLANAPILILDEATSSLDSESESYIQEALKILMKGKTTLVIAHRLSTIKHADRILVFDKGEIIEQGSHKELLKKTGGHYKKFYEMQAGGFIGD
jgi:ATP-binding cassette subfamily B protein